jgi:hypothetical protein
MKDKVKGKIKLFIGNLVILSSVSRSLVGVGNQHLGTKNSNVTIPFFLMYEDLL